MSRKLQDSHGILAYAVCSFTFSDGGVAVYRCSEAACYMYPSGYMLAGSHHLSRVSYLMKRHVETCVLDENFKK
uniref:Uncharacterized protein n=1 Tax=Strongyloides venezuelensis TaxID=75913 RepID=A0A0K0FGI3_STRVS